MDDGLCMRAEICIMSPAHPLRVSASGVEIPCRSHRSIWVERLARFEIISSVKIGRTLSLTEEPLLFAQESTSYDRDDQQKENENQNRNEIDGPRAYSACRAKEERLTIRSQRRHRFNRHPLLGG